MTVAGVELGDGRRIWAHTGTVNVQPLDMVVVHTGDVTEQGIVFLSPDQLMAQSPSSDSLIVSRIEPETRLDYAGLPGADMPPLGSSLSYEGEHRLVCGIDPIARTADLGTPEDHVTVSVDEGGIAQRLI